MRIIAGRCRSRRLHSPPAEAPTRPMTDRVKQSLFDRLTVSGHVPADPDQAPAGHVLDLFAGNGGLGLECLSRGYAHATFVERDRRARRVLEQNIAELGLSDHAHVRSADVLGAHWPSLLPHQAGLIDLAFSDPPYRMVEHANQAQRLAESMQRLLPHLAAAGLLLLRTPDRIGPLTLAGFSEPDTWEYRTMSLHAYRPSPTA